MDKDVSAKKKRIEGRVLKFGNNINTDIISPPQYMELGIEKSSKYAMSAICPDFLHRVQTNRILVAEDNFGSGSSRETSPLSLKYLGVEAVVAKFFARIFYRNAINVGLFVLECKDTDRICEDDRLQIDYEKGMIYNLTKNENYTCTKIPAHLFPILESGGLVEFLRNS